jgi:hypothetical protein
VIELAKKKAVRYEELIDSCDTGAMMADRPRLRHMKLQAFAGGGKSHFALTFFAYQAKGLKPEETLCTIIDCDLEGQTALVRREDIIPKELRPRLIRKVCRTPTDVNEISLAFIDLHRQHKEKYPNGCRVMICENEAAFYVGCRDFYSQEVHGKSEADLMLERQSQAIAEGKKTLPAFKEGQMHSYKVINRLFFTPYERLKIGAEMFQYHFISTVLLREYTENYGTANEKRVVTAAGRADMTDPIFDWIIEFHQQQRARGKEIKTRHIAIVRKSRDCEPFQLMKPTQEKFWKAVEDNRS